MRRTNGATSSCWEPVLSGDEAANALGVSRNVARRLRDPEQVELAIQSAKRCTDFPQSIHWRPEGLWQGYAGLAVLWGSMDRCLPDEGWDDVGLVHLRRASGAIEKRRDLSLGLSTGLGGLAVAAWALSRGGARYARMLSTLDRTLVDLIESQTAEIVRTRIHGVGVGTFDVISGLTGVGRYLLLRQDVPSCRRALESVLRCVIYLSEEDADGVPHWYTAPEFLDESFLNIGHPNGTLNLGLAHGAPGPLALLSLAAMQGVEQTGQIAAIDRIAAWLSRSRIEDEWGINFPTAIAMGSQRRGARLETAPRPSRSAWCYGTPGIARALWLAGNAADRPVYRELAVEAMEAVYRRPVEARGIGSPTFCHGVAGLLQVTLRFAHESGLRVFVDAARTLLEQLLSAHEPDTLIGYRNLEPTGNRIDQPGILDGAAGVALVLLAAATPTEPVWDSAFLLS